LNPGKTQSDGRRHCHGMDEQDLADIDLDKLEEALNKKDLKTIPDDQLRKVHKVFLDSTDRSHFQARHQVQIQTQIPGRSPRKTKDEG
jgi:hypothetical protein